MPTKLIPKELIKRPERLAPGHRLCAGCGAPIVVRQVMLAIDEPVVLANATGCLPMKRGMIGPEATLETVSDLFALGLEKRIGHAATDEYDNRIGIDASDLLDQFNLGRFEGKILTVTA